MRSSLSSGESHISERRNARSRRTGAAILKAARDILESDGFDGLTMGAIAERAKISRRAVYLHFASRSEVVAALFDFVTEAEGLDESVSAVWSAPDSASALDAWARHFARFHPRVMAVTRAVERVHGQDTDAARHRERYLREQMSACRRIAEWLASEGRLASGWTIETASEMLWGLISVDMLDRLLLERGWSEQSLAEHLSLLLRSTFVTHRP